MTNSDNQSTVRLHRVLKAPPDRVYQAFVDGRAREYWLPPYGFLGQIHENDPKVGGRYRMSFINFGTGSSHSFGGVYKTLIPGEKVTYTAQFETPPLPGEMVTEVVLKKVLCGTEIEVVQSGIPPQIPTEMCYLGWQESLLQLAALVEPTIPDQG